MELDRKSTVRLRLRESDGSRTLQRQGDMQLMQNKLFLEQVESEKSNEASRKAAVPWNVGACRPIRMSGVMSVLSQS